MPVLIDGNNLLHAALSAEALGPQVGRGTLCKLLGAWARATGERVRIVFDGPPPRNQAMERQIGDPAVMVRYSGAVTADEVLIGDIGVETAPRRLRVVSSDRAVAGAARRRRAHPVRSEDFWTELRRALRRPPPRSLEPPEKSAGLSGPDVESWLRELGFEDRASEGGDAGSKGVE